MSDQSSRPRPFGGQPPEAMFRLLVEQVRDYAIFGLDDRGIVVSWNAGAERIKGYTASEIIGHHFSRLYPEEAIRAGWPQTELKNAAEHGRFEDEGWRVRKDGSKFWANAIITALYDDEGVLRGYAKVTRDLSDRKRAESIEADARQISQFVAMLGHELRNPIAPIRNAVELARHGDNPERTQRALEIIDRQSGHLARLVDDLLDVTRITQKQFRLERRRVALVPALEAAIEAVRPSCDQRGHSLTVDLRANGLVRGDPIRLTQVFTNLLTNACKYTPAGGRIEVELDASADQATFSVRDTGIGIEPDLLPHVFDTFTQERRSLGRSEGGLGLGLAISRRLVELHGGLLTVESPGPGSGTTAKVTLPLLGRLSADGADAPSPGALVVLVVDDNRDAAEMLAATLEAQGHTTWVAVDGREGIRLAMRELPNLVLLDIGMPGLDGYEVARVLRNEPSLQGVMLVAVTGYGADEDRRRALEAGFDIHLSKPVDSAKLVRHVPILAR